MMFEQVTIFIDHSNCLEIVLFKWF